MFHLTLVQLSYISRIAADYVEKMYFTKAGSREKSSTYEMQFSINIYHDFSHM